MNKSRRFWIAFGDIHQRISAVTRIEDLDKASGVLLNGDLTNIGSRVDAEHVLDAVRSKNPRIFAQVGNMDTASVERFLTEQEVNVHARVTDLGGGVGLAAVGRSTPTPFGTPSEESEEQICQWVHGVLKESAAFSQVILMVHTPPRGEVVDKLFSGNHVGSPGVRSLIERYQPAVVVTGHIHEGYGEEMIGRSHVLNPGSFADGGYVRIDESDMGLVASLRKLA